MDFELCSHGRKSGAVDSSDSDGLVGKWLVDMLPNRLKLFTVTAPRSVEHDQPHAFVFHWYEPVSNELMKYVESNDVLWLERQLNLWRWRDAYLTLYSDISSYLHMYIFTHLSLSSKTLASARSPLNTNNVARISRKGSILMALNVNFWPRIHTILQLSVKVVTFSLPFQIVWLHSNKGYYRLYDNGNHDDTLKSCTQCPTTANPTDVDNQERAGVRGDHLLIFFDVNPDLKIESTSVSNRLNFYTVDTIN